MKKLLNWNGILLVIIFLAAFLRFWQLGDMPAGFHRDEVLSGYLGRFVLENGRDVYGNLLPLFHIDKYGDYPPAIPMYLSGVATIFFGVNVFTTRLPVAILGVLVLIPLFFITLTLFRNKRVATASVFFLAILPWHIVLSRATAEGIVALTIATWGLLHLIQFIKNQKLLFLLAALLLFAFTYLLYPSYRLFIPLLLLPIPFLFPLKKTSKYALVGGMIILTIATTLIASTDWGRGRFEQTSISGELGRKDTQARIQILAQEEGHNKITEVKTFHNKYIMQGRQIVHQYVSYFSPEYLFNAGGLPYRYSVADQGLLPFTLLPLLLIALFFIRDIERRMALFLLYILAISPLPSPLTIDDVPNVHRTLFMVIPLTLLAGFGFMKLIDLFSNPWMRKGLVVLVVGLLSIELFYFSHMYYHHANAVKSSERGDTNKELITYVIGQKENFERIYMPTHDAFPFYYLFFTSNFDQQLIGKVEKNLVVKELDNITFTDSYCPSKDILLKDTRKNILILERDECQMDSRLKVVHIFTRHDGTTSYRLFVPK